MNFEDMKLKGYVREYVDGILIVEHPNAIHDDLQELFGQWMRGNNISNAISDLFPSDNEQAGGAQDGNDGICLRDSEVGSDNYFSLTTTMENDSYNTYGVQWKGVLQSDADRTVDYIYIGSGFGTSGAPFDNTFASIDKTADTVDLVVNQTYEVTWGIYPS